MPPSKTSKTPRPAAKVSNAKITKRPSQANKSILNFFQKVDRPEESMFVGGETGLGVAITTTEGNDDIYGADDHDPVLEERYNEAELPSKRRKLSDTEGTNGENVAPVPAKPEAEFVTKTSPAKSSQPKKPKRKGPFLDDSDSESETEVKGNGKSPDGKSPEEVPAAKDQEVRPAIISTEEHERTSLTPSHDAVSSTSPPALKQEPSTNSEQNNFANLDDDFDDELFEGEELREMRFTKEQARLEAEEEGIQTCDDGLETLMEDDGMTESCPICNASLAGVTPNEAIVHVNSCLDGNLTPLPTNDIPKQSAPTEPPPAKSRSTSEGNEDLISAPELGKRFARAAVARPGQENPISLSKGGEPSTNGGSTSAFSKLMSGHAEDAAWATAAATESASRGKPAYQRTCPFYKIMPGFNICVDAFRYGAVEGCRAYFLSHFHSDHYVGLTASWTHGPIYCSKVTGSLVKSQLKTAEKYVVELDFDKKVPVPGTEGVSVTMIPANHCPGSSLFLFEKAVSYPNQHANSKERRVQRILHCGDFRACPAHIEHPQLKPETTDALGKVKQQKIDVCYLDTTYLNPRYSFPPQNDVIRACAELCLELDTSLRAEDETKWHSVLRRREGRGIGNNDTVSRFFVAADKPDEASPKTTRDNSGDDDDDTATATANGPNAFTALGQKARENRNRLLVVCGTYSIGKERICKAIALALRTKIYASPAKIRMCHQLGDPELASLMTPDPREAQVHMQMLMELRAETLAEYLDHHRPHFGRVVGFRPSGWSYRPTMANNSGRGGKAAAAAVPANMPPSSVPATQILHGPAWRTRFGTGDLVPQQGSSRDAMCFGAPYSEHSSFRELMLFVMGLRIEKVVPTVNVGSEPGRRRMKGWTDRWLSERRRGGVVRIVREVGDGGEDMLCDDGEAKPVEGEGVVKEEEEGAKGKKDVVLWDGRDGRGGGVYW
ncbi:DNA cross-link repair protein PSO2/SNM1 [Cytospora paraplurivora]|uniref:DNA cross-link repair protein PSO2/SNM1 n=1 Tax=Cytospora paraplurivora TaxID=2898453 RepID=A0AAN9U671_9PEZI